MSPRREAGGDNKLRMAGRHTPAHADELGGFEHALDGRQVELVDDLRNVGGSSLRRNHAETC